ncbi:MAG: helix-hairpin-helix domain-containing protein [Proteobacteria bacterium]|nr:helix-hairpin-helix domain-containing protein [Pseudomonadota bacterium]MBU4294376.1 helix-hairpin-helix domain-containing protein [Pseudomonadota bacterium]MCG2749442.1 phospholipase D-like domain-containing protein [Desulfobulbaceae bacterium]
MKDTVTKKICCLLFIVLLLAVRPETAPALTGRININTASAQQLQELPYIGEKRAQAIVAYRQSHGPFHSLDQLVDVADIGEKSLEAIKSYLALDTGSPRETSPSDVTFHKKISTGPGDIIVLADGKYFPTLVDYLKTAEHSIDMTMFLFKTTSSPGNKPAILVNELIAARKKGVDVRLVLENSGYDESLNKENESVARKLRKYNIRVFFDSPDTTTHAKIVVIDRRYSFIGSHNLTHSALAYNHEASLLIDNSDLAAQLTAYMDTLH